VTDFLRKPLNPKETIDRVKRYSPIPTSVSAASAPVPASSVTAAAEPVPAKIEDLLGWSQDAPSPFSELSQDRSTGFDFSLPVSDGPSDGLSTTEFLDRNELTPSDQPTPAAEPAFAEISNEPKREAEPRLSPAASPVETPQAAHTAAMRNGNTLPPQSALEGASRDIAREIVEKIAWDVVPGLAKQSLERVVHEVVERIVWDVVPAVAEAAIKREIERLTRDA
jgi:hypothetical protein